MTKQPEDNGADSGTGTPEAGGPDAPPLAEDLLLLRFQPDSGTIAGETLSSTSLPERYSPISPSKSA